MTDFFKLSDLPLLRPHWNVAPTQSVPIIREGQNGERELIHAHWGLIPSWAKDPAIGHKMINARSETVYEKPAFRHSIKSQRCIVPASGFFEWAKQGKVKIPYYFSMSNGDPMALAGIWESWQTPEGDFLISFSILTTGANSLLLPIHDRMPVICSLKDFDFWLNRSAHAMDKLQSVFQPFPAELIQSWPVSTMVNNPTNNSEHCIQPARSH